MSFPAKITCSVVRIDSHLSVSIFLYVTVNKSTLGLFNDDRCHRNSLLLSGERKRRERLKGSWGQRFVFLCVCVGQVIFSM